PNTLADEFIGQTLDRRVSATHHTGEWLSKQLKELKATLEDSEQRLHNYVASNGLLFTSEKDSVAEANLRQLQTALLGAHEARVGILERLRKAYESALRRERLLRSDYDGQMQVVTTQSSKEVAYNTLKREVDGNRQLYETTLQRVKEADVASAIRANNIQIVD